MGGDRRAGKTGGSVKFGCQKQGELPVRVRVAEPKLLGARAGLLQCRARVERFLVGPGFARGREPGVAQRSPVLEIGT
jgi:hypothetical protein